MSIIELGPDVMPAVAAAPPRSAAPSASRLGRVLRLLGRACVDGLATDNGWLWAYGAGCPAVWVHRTWPSESDPWTPSAAGRSMPTRG